MNIRKHISTGLALAALALGLTAVKANAEPILRGTFELPAAAYFGDKLLQPGQYTIWMSSETRDISNVPVVHLTGEGVNIAYLAIARPAAESKHNFLDVQNVAGTYVIEAFDAGTIGETFSFGVTRNVKSKALRASVEPAMAVPVLSASGF